MPPILAAYADQVILDALRAFVPVAVIAVTFGFVYWLIRRRQSRRDDAQRKQWIEERRGKRAGGKKEPGEL